uniref:Metallothiol transferase FosB n=1 Tax=Noccaea caerulescens TaxID=107243 RepID=A0A1J3CWH3_NOCCA
MKENTGNPLHLKSLNHISLLCRSVEESMSFYQNVLGFLPIRRPGSFDFDGAWLFGHGIGIHLLQSPEPEKLLKKTEINPKDNHISFQCESMEAVEKKLKEMEMEHVRAVVEEGGIQVDQVFFHDPDGFMIEICNCDSFPVVPLAGEMARSCSRLNLHQPPAPSTSDPSLVNRFSLLSSSPL